MRKNIFLVALLLCVSGCISNPHLHYLRSYNISEPTTNNFTHCFNYGCQRRTQASLPESTKEKLIRLFTPIAHDKKSERDLISQAIQIFEQDIGELAGTNHDIRGTFRLYEEGNKVKGPQQDCTDESTNTTIYLALLDQLSLLKFYKPAYPANRQPFFSGAPWWHQTAVMQDKETKEKFAVDSWFRNNGEPAYIVPYKEWKNGWMPPKK